MKLEFKQAVGSVQTALTVEYNALSAAEREEAKRVVERYNPCLETVENNAYPESSAK